MTADMKRFGQQVLIAVIIVLLFVAVAYSIEILLLVFGGILLGILFRSVGTWLAQKTRPPIQWCMAIVVIGFGALVFGSIAMFGLQIINQADELFWSVSQAYDQFHDKLAQYHVAGSLAAGTGGLNLESPVKAAASHALWLVAAMVMVIFIGVYVSLNPQLYADLFLSFFKGQRRRVARLLEATASALRWWLAGQFIAMFNTGWSTCRLR